MKNTLIQNIISNFQLMDKEHFLEWFWENRKWMIEQEKKQIIDYDESLEFDSAEKYYNKNFIHYVK